MPASTPAADSLPSTGPFDYLLPMHICGFAVEGFPLRAASNRLKPFHGKATYVHGKEIVERPSAGDLSSPDLEATMGPVHTIPGRVFRP